MATLRDWVTRLLGTLRRKRSDRELEEELGTVVATNNAAIGVPF